MEKKTKAASSSIDFLFWLKFNYQRILWQLWKFQSMCLAECLSRPHEWKGGWLKRSLFIVVEKFCRFESRSLSRAPKPWREVDKGLSQRRARGRRRRRTISNWLYQSSKSGQIKEVWSKGRCGWCPWLVFTLTARFLSVSPSLLRPA